MRWGREEEETEGAARRDISAAGTFLTAREATWLTVLKSETTHRENTPSPCMTDTTTGSTLRESNRAGRTAKGTNTHKLEGAHPTTG